jgi:hypothetical protein
VKSVVVALPTHAVYGFIERCTRERQLVCAALLKGQMLNGDDVVLVGVAFENLKVMDLVRSTLDSGQVADDLSDSSWVVRIDESIDVKPQVDADVVRFEFCRHFPELTKGVRRFFNETANLFHVVNESGKPLCLSLVIAMFNMTSRRNVRVKSASARSWIDDGFPSPPCAEQVRAV